MSTEYIKAMTNLASVSNFRCVTDNTHCLFAKRAIIFGSPDYNSSISVQKNILLCLPSLIKFVKLADQGESIDAYLIEIRNKNYGSSVESLAALVRIVLTTIAQNDPTGLNVMNMKSINTNMWYFSLSSVPLFLTTFAPCYKSNNSRFSYATEATAHSCFILFQPEISFLRHNIPLDTTITNWDNPQSIREKIRINFRNHGQMYVSNVNRVNSFNIVMPQCSGYIGENDINNNIQGIEFWNEQLYPDINQ